MQRVNRKITELFAGDWEKNESSRSKPKEETNLSITSSTLNITYNFKVDWLLIE
jgi:hypothetical protein